MPHLLGSPLYFHPDLARKGQQRPGRRQAGGCLTYLLPSFLDSKTPWRHNHPRLQMALLTPALESCTPEQFQRQGKQQGSHQIPVLKSPFQSAGWAGSACAAGAAIATLLSAIPTARQIPQLRSRAITPQALCRQNIHLAIYMICNVKRLSDGSLRTAALAISSVQYFQNSKVPREKCSYFD